MKKIISINNPEIKNIIKLKKARERKRQGLILVEGRHEVFLARESGLDIKKLYYSSEFVSDENFKIETDDVVEVEKEIFKKISLREKPDGYLGLFYAKEFELEKVKLGKNPLVIVLEAVEKPGNLGAILRTADAVQADAVLVCNLQTDIFNPNVIRASLGTVFTNQLVVCSSSEAISWLKKNGIKIFSTTPEASVLYFEANFSESVAIIVGTEHEGLSQIWLDEADKKIKIPMLGRVDSLNVSVSAGVVVYEARRQRK